MYDCIVIGGGIVGSAVLRELSKFNLRLLMLEKEEDVACGCSKANSGIVHAGYDAVCNSLKAKFNVLGNKMYKALAEELGVPLINNGSLVLAKEDGLSGLQTLLARGLLNGVEGLQILDRQQLLLKEPNIADCICYGLYAPSACIVSPYEMTIALAEQAVINGAEVMFESEVTAVTRTNNGFKVTTNKGVYDCKVLINCAGYGADKINALAGGSKIDYLYTRGDYFILDSVERKNYTHTCFPLPDQRGKGVLVSPTADGNVILGPTSIAVSDGDDTAVSASGLDYIKASVSEMLKNVNFRKSIRVFAGVRASFGGDFVIEQKDNLITLAGICSPGLSSAPAIALHVAEVMLPKTNIVMTKKPTFLPRLHRPLTRDMTKEEFSKLIESNPLYAKMVCRCERITEGEIVDALNSPLKPSSLDALKRRVRVGMGRCQGGFCTQRVMEIIARERKIPLRQVTKLGKGSEIILANIKEEL
ncbi:MAG: NAD(P)/FAD-dependent oxidoreductase [Clostridia bacterium]